MDSSYLELATSGTRLRLPQKVSLPSGGLTEMTASENNARSAMPPPAPANGYNTLKHKPAGLHESQSKARKTLVEKAGEPRSKQVAPSTIRQVNSSASSFARAPPKIMAPSVSSTHGASTRGIRGPGFASSYSSASGSRPGIPRAQTAMGHNRSQSQYNSRPISAFGHTRSLSQSSQVQHPDAEPAKDGMRAFLTSANPAKAFSKYNVNNSFHIPRRNISAQSNVSSTTRSSVTTLVGTERSVSDPFSNPTSSRSSSLCEQFLGMRLDRAQDHLSKNAQIEDRLLMPPPSPIRNPKGKSSLPRLSPVKGSEPTCLSVPCSAMRPSPAPTPQFKIPVPKTQRLLHTSPCRTPTPVFLNKESLTPMPAWGEAGVNKRLEGIDEMFKFMKNQMEGTTFEQKSMKEIVELQRDQMAQLQLTCKNLSLESESLRSQLSDERENMSTLLSGQIEEHRNHEIAMDDLERDHRHEMEDLRSQHRKEVDGLRREASEEDDKIRRQHREEIDELLRKHRQEIEDLERRFKAELDQEKERRLREVNEISVQRDEAISKIATGIGEKAREADLLHEDIRQRTADLEREKMVRTNLETRLTEATANFLSLESSNSAMRAKIEFLESDNQQQSQQFADIHRRMQDAIDAAAVANEKLRAEESLRRKLHNQVQELKGNIRVFCRVRPPLGEEEDVAKIGFPDEKEESKEIAVRGPETRSALGNVTAANHAFAFDRVFGPESANGDVFDEISQLVQSALDGYNVCIFCYGQTGSGKTFTMSSSDGMIPRAVRQIYESATALEEKGWKYTMQGSFVEVYNENINDLLGKAEDLDRKKHEIHHDMKRCKTTITDIETIELDSPERVQEVLKTADRNRTVAATKANMRSSRSHSVFILTLMGENSITGEKCEGTLNLVDLAGSERLSHSQAEGQRLKETQSINKSLSCLGDVIGALGSGKGEGGHIPYRNSKLTYLLQFSLGGNSKTLMFVMVSPLQAHLGETLTSLKFATKVHNTHIGTAKRQSKITPGH